VKLWWLVVMLFSLHTSLVRYSTILCPALPDVFIDIFAGCSKKTA
jgi:hypothetical protein